MRSRARSHPAFAAQPGARPPLPCHRDWTRRQGRVGDRRVIHIRTSYPQTWCLQQRGGDAAAIVKGWSGVRLLIVGAVVLSCLTACAFDGPITVRTPGCINAHGDAGSAGDEIVVAVAADACRATDGRLLPEVQVVRHAGPFGMAGAGSTDRSD